MKQLLIIRHAKSSWDISTLNDFDRSLNERGLRDAPMMAKRLHDKKVSIDAFVSSTAKRAFTTAKYFANEFGLNENLIIKKLELYHASSSVFYKVISDFNNDFNSIAVFSHNPGITYFVNALTKTKIDNMPTSGIFAINIHTNDWKNFYDAPKKLMFFDYPKNI